MRIPRSQQLADRDIVHSTWRGHNNEWIFKSPPDKRAYLALLDAEAAKHDYRPHAFAIMSNHDHNMGRVEAVVGYSSFFKAVHGCYAQRYNRENNRRGAVGTGRPTSTVVQDSRHQLNAMFYIDANPVRAGLVRHPHHYPWSSHNFYAYGTRGPGTASLEPPDWYLELGKTPQARRQAYRRQCDAYLRQAGLLPAPGQPSGFYADVEVRLGERSSISRSPAHHRRGQAPADPALAGPAPHDTG